MQKYTVNRLLGLGRTSKKKRNKKPTRKKRQNRSSALGGLRALTISTCDTLLTYTMLFKDGARKKKRRIERRIFYGTRLFSAECDFSHVRQIAHIDLRLC